MLNKYLEIPNLPSLLKVVLNTLRKQQPRVARHRCSEKLWQALGWKAWKIIVTESIHGHDSLQLLLLSRYVPDWSSFPFIMFMITASQEKWIKLTIQTDLKQGSLIFLVIQRASWESNLYQLLFFFFTINNL